MNSTGGREMLFSLTPAAVSLDNQRTATTATALVASSPAAIEPGTSPTLSRPSFHLLAGFLF